MRSQVRIHWITNFSLLLVRRYVLTHSTGSILLLSKVSNRNEPLGLRNAPGRTSSSSLPSPYAPTRSGSIPRPAQPPPPTEKKRTADGKIVLEPQPDESMNDPLNWPTWRRDCALLSLGFYCMLGGGMTTILAAGFTRVSATFHISTSRVALTTGLYMMGLGIGSVIVSPTAILFGKRPVYLVASIVFILTSIWCALSPNYASLVVARIFMGLAVSPVECLPSATVAEIFFLHERAYRLGIYTLLLLGGKNLIPLVSAAIIESLGWRWVFWIVAIIVGFGGILLFFFVPETFWDRTPRPHHWDQHHAHNKASKSRLGSTLSIGSFFRHTPHDRQHDIATEPDHADGETNLNLRVPGAAEGTLAHKRLSRHAHFRDDDEKAITPHDSPNLADAVEATAATHQEKSPTTEDHANEPAVAHGSGNGLVHRDEAVTSGASPRSGGFFQDTAYSPATSEPESLKHTYTNYYRRSPPKTFIQSLRPYSGRLSHDNWFRVASRPFILFCYPAILWSSLVYALSVGWLIVLSESVSTIYESRDTYGFNSFQAGLVYLSPFIGGVLGTAVAGKVSDYIVRWMSRRNGGIYEPEFRLIMAIPVAISTTIGLMGYGWSAQERDGWIVPTVFFGIISFGCCVGSTTAITFAVDSYRQYAGEALVTLNFSKSESFFFPLSFLSVLVSFLVSFSPSPSLYPLIACTLVLTWSTTDIFHGLVFSLFFNTWLSADGSKTVFLALGGIQLACLLFTIPMYVYGKRARMWTVRRNLMEKF